MRRGHKEVDGGWWIGSGEGSSRISAGGNAFNQCKTLIQRTVAGERVDSVRDQPSEIPSFVLATKAVAEAWMIGCVRRDSGCVLVSIGLRGPFRPGSESRVIGPFVSSFLRTRHTHPIRSQTLGVFGCSGAMHQLLSQHVKIKRLVSYT
jgi:hypothetical protein